uniref:Uncharacterized protein LOC101511496 n=1 Tax=Rhizophora mucronata TaxID=61149 RepID=A0A2P2QBW6_RHIMU
MKKVHEGLCKSHVNGLSMVEKILRVGCYWSTME